MGFRCPLCHKDFGVNKEAWSKHCDTCGNGVVRGVVDMTINQDSTKLEEYLKTQIVPPKEEA